MIPVAFNDVPDLTFAIFLGKGLGTFLAVGNEGNGRNPVFPETETRDVDKSPGYRERRFPIFARESTNNNSADISEKSFLPEKPFNG